MRPQSEVPVLTEAIIGKQDYIRLADLVLAALMAPSRPAGSTEALEAFDRKLAQAVVTDGPAPVATIAIGSTARVRDLDTGQERSLTLVWPGEERAPDRISVLTAFGSTLLGLSKGQTATYRTLDGRSKRLTVLAAHGPPAPSDD